jgi:diacylglycerol kinase family enzyme
MKLVVVYNSKGGGRFTAKVLKELFAAHDVEIEKMIPVDDFLDETVEPFIKAGAMIAAIGGDGTISSLAAKIVGSDATLVPLPGGTLNHFTKDLGVSQDMNVAIANLHTAKTHLVDVGAVNGTVFINNSSIGLYPSSLRFRGRYEKFLGKWLAATIASARAFVRFKTYSVTINNETFRTPFVFIGNNIYKLDGANGVVRSSLDEATLSVFIARTSSRLVLFKIVLFAAIGRVKLLDEFDERQTTKLHIQSKSRRLSVSRDGEVKRTVSPLMYEIRRGALKVFY